MKAQSNDYMIGRVFGSIYTTDEDGFFVRLPVDYVSLNVPYWARRQYCIDKGYYCKVAFRS